MRGCVVYVACALPCFCLCGGGGCFKCLCHSVCVCVCLRARACQRASVPCMPRACVPVRSGVRVSVRAACVRGVRACHSVSVCVCV